MQSVTESKLRVRSPTWKILIRFTFTTVLSVIRMVKLFGWENKVNEQIAEKRDSELSFLKKRRLLELLNNNIKWLILIPLSSNNAYKPTAFSSHYWPWWSRMHVMWDFSYCLFTLTSLIGGPSWQTTFQKEVMSASKVFSTMAVFDTMRDTLHLTFYLVPVFINGTQKFCPCAMLAWLITMLYQAKVSLDRINNFLLNV